MHVTISCGKQFMVKGSYSRFTYEIPKWIFIEMNRPNPKINSGILEFSRNLFGISNNYYHNLPVPYHPEAEFMPSVMNIFWLESEEGENLETEKSEQVLSLFSNTFLQYNNFEGLQKFLEDFDWTNMRK